jgi:hypothetical protein
MATNIGTFEVNTSDAAFMPFHNGTGERFYRKRITFKRPFQQTPEVTVSIAGIDIAAGKNARLRVHAEKADAQGFELVIETWWDTQMWRVKAAWVAHVETPSKPDVVISNVNYKGTASKSQSDEYVEITNRGTGPADLSGWHLNAGNAGQDFTFPAGTTLAAGQSIRVYTNEVHPGTGGFSFGFGRSIWNDAGDVARLQDAAGSAVTELAYGNKKTGP